MTTNVVFNSLYSNQWLIFKFIVYFTKSTALKKVFLLFVILIVSSCEKDIPLKFEETSIEKKEPVSIEVIYPKLNDASDVSSKINQSIETNIASQIAFFDEETDSLKLDDAITQFENRFVEFKNDFEADATPWEVNINGEVVFQSPSVITVSVDSYTYTGGAHGNGVVTLLNFNPETGDLYTQDELYKKSPEFMKLVEDYFKTEIDKKGNDNPKDYFFGEDFKLPENIGFNEEGVVFLYNTYEMASYAQGITEFVIPYSVMSKYLKISY